MSSGVFAQANCRVSILTEKFSGHKMRVNFQSSQPKESYCRKLAEMHLPNFNPDIVRKKSVSYAWNGQLTQLGQEKFRSRFR
jgi:hypothetical protein